MNLKLSENTKKRVIYHELGHLDHTTELYQNNHTRCENEANRFMIRNLIQEELAGYDDLSDFNWSDFAKKYNLKTTTDEVMIQDEYLKFVSGI